MNPAKLRERITVEKLKSAPTVDAAGEVDLNNAANWETLLTSAAQVVPRGQKVFTQAGIQDADVTHLLRVRRSALALTITHGMRIQWDGLTLHILSAFPSGEDRRLLDIHTRY